MTKQELAAVRRRCRREPHFWTSLHEAAHAVFALRLGEPFEYVVVFDFNRQILEDELDILLDEGDLDGVLVPTEGDYQNPVSYALVHLAGVVFEGWMGNTNGSQADFDSAIGAVGRKAMGTLIPRASEMLTQEFDSVVRLGEELSCRGRMTEQECRELLGVGHQHEIGPTSERKGVERSGESRIRRRGAGCMT